METLRQIARPTSYLVLLCLIGLSSYIPAANAAVISTETLATSDQIEAERNQLKQFLARDEVKSYLRANGVEPASVQARVDRLTDEEVHALAGRLDEHPAAGDGFTTLLILAFLAFVALLITDLLGYTDVFPFVKKSGK